jgi:hypothetical protein
VPEYTVQAFGGTPCDRTPVHTLYSTEKEEINIREKAIIKGESL